MKERTQYINKYLKTAALILALLVMLLTSVSQAALASESSGPLELCEITPVGDVNTVPPEITAKSAAMYSIELEDFVFAKDADKKYDPYSITKALTCYIALENLDPEAVHTASEKAAQVYENGTTIFLKAGEKMTIKDLVYGAMLESGNDAAYALGEAVAGSEKDFAELMNKTVRDWGCNDTNFVNANGWKNKNHYTTAHDMAIIARKCFSNETLAEISRTKTYTIPATNLSAERELKNYTLHTVSKAKGVTYGKTGSWDEDDCSIILGFAKEGLNEIIVLLKDTKTGRKSDVLKLIDFSDKVTPGFLVSNVGDIVEIAKVRHGEFTEVGLTVDGKTYAYPASKRAEDIKVEIRADKLEAPLTKGDKAGTYTVYCNGEVVGEHSLIITEDIKTGWLPSYLYISNHETIVIAEYLAGILVLLFLLIVIIKKAAKRRKPKYEARH